MLKENVFGILTLKKFSIGDVVCWSELQKIGSLYSVQKEKRFGVISKLEIVDRGDRKVAIAGVIPVDNTEYEKEVLVVCLTLISKVSKNKEF